MSAGTDEVRYIRYLRRVLWFALAVGAATVGAVGAILLTTGQATAQPLQIPGVGVIEVPNGIRIPAPIPAIRNATNTPRIAPAAPVAPVPGVVHQLESAIPGLDLHSLFAAPEMRSVIPLAPQSMAPAPYPGAMAVTPPPAQALAPQALTPHSMAPHAMTPHKTKGERAVEAARSKLGSGYRYGSAGPDAFDCSGLVKWSYAQAGVDLPRTSYEQLNSGTAVPLNDLQPGDLVSYNGGSHSAIYAGGGRIIHAATESTGVTTSPLDEMSITGARRF